MTRSPEIGYILKRFPRLSETFILNELLQLEQLGVGLQIVSRVDPADLEPVGVRNELVEKLDARVIYLRERLSRKGYSIKRGSFSSGQFIEESWNEFRRRSSAGIGAVSYLDA